MTDLHIKGNLFDPAKLTPAAYGKALMSTLFNQRTLTQKPDLMVQPKDVDDVIDTVNYACSIGKKLSICSGGHSWSSNHMRDNSILLDMHFFNTFEINPEASTAVAGPATDGGDLLKAAMKQGLFFPSGHCKGVAIGGYLLQGGFGWNSRKLGMACESVLGLDIVTADGELIHANEFENSDLYWAARGSGPGFFGVVVAYHLQLHPKPKYIRAMMHCYKMEHLEGVFRWAAEIGPDVPAAAEFQIAMTQRTALFMGPGLEMFTPIFADSRDELEETKKIMNSCPVRQKAFLRLPCMPVSMNIMYRGVMAHYPHDHCYDVDNIWTNASIDELMPHLKEIGDTIPAAPTHMLWLNWYPPKSRPDMAFSMEDNIYIALYNIYKGQQHSAARKMWATNQVRKMEHLSSGIQLADENLNHRTDKFMADDNFAKLAGVRERYDSQRLFNEWHSKPSLIA